MKVNFSTLHLLLLILCFSIKAEEVAEEEEDEVAVRLRKKEAMRKHKMPTTTQAPGARFKTEDMIVMAHKKPSKTGISLVAQVSSGGKLTLDMVDNLVGSEWHNYCGCGEDSCEKNGRCKKNQYRPICCFNRCYCVKMKSEFEWQDYWISLKRETACKLLGCNNPQKPSCYDAQSSEWNCWSGVTNKNSTDSDELASDEDVPKEAKYDFLGGGGLTETEPTTQFIYAGCGMH